MALNQNMPMEPNEIPGDTISGETLATPEQVQSLWDLMDQIETKYREMNAEKFAGSNQVDSNKKDLVVEVFKALQNAGIDISNVDEVRKFLDELQSSNPDLYQMFVDSFNGLLGGATETAGAQPGVGEMGPTSPADLSGSLGAMSGGASAAPGGVPSNEGLSGMMPPTGGSPMNQFPNLVK